MNKHLPVVLLTLFFTMPCADELIDDFERGESKICVVVTGIISVT